MRQSQFFSKTSKTPPKDEEAANAKLLIRGGFVRKMSAGVYAYLPLAWRVLDKINAIVREEMNALGAEEMLMPALVAREYWQTSKRWHTGIAYEFASPFGDEFGLGWTHEEVITAIATHFIQSYHDLPRAAYQIQNKYRAEPRAKNGLLRGREFMMKDLYSFHATTEDLNDYYQKAIEAYKKVYKRLALEARVTEAAGGQFTDEYTHEFQVLAPTGEDTIYYCNKCDFSQNKEIAHVQGGNQCPKCQGEIQEGKAIEVGNVFKLGTKYSDAFGLQYTDADGGKKPVIMGSYGIGITRVLASLVEVHHDDRGIMWPESVAPYRVHLIALGADKDAKVKKQAEVLYKKMQKAGVEVLYDDRDASAGEKLADADLLGMPWRAIVSAKTEGKVELKKRAAQKPALVSVEDFLKKVGK